MRPGVLLYDLSKQIAFHLCDGNKVGGSSVSSGCITVKPCSAEGSKAAKLDVFANCSLGDSKERGCLSGVEEAFVRQVVCGIIRRTHLKHSASLRNALRYSMAR